MSGEVSGRCKCRSLISFLPAVIFALWLGLGLTDRCCAQDFKNNRKQTFFGATSCSSRKYVKTSKHSNTRGVFELLTANEMTSVQQFMYSAGLITVNGGKPSLNDSYIFGMTLFPPRKWNVLRHLDGGRRSPGRYAKVHVHRGNKNPPDLMEYKVGPIGRHMRSVPLYKDNELHYNTRPRDGVEWDGMVEEVAKAMKILRPLLRKSFDGAFFPDGGLAFHPQAPPGLEPEERETRFIMTFDVKGTARGRDLHPLPLTGAVHNPGVDKSKWYVYDLYYLNQGPFATAADLLHAYKSGKIRKFSFPRGYRKTIYEKTYPKRNSEKLRKFADRAPPRSYEPDGARYTVKDHTIKWMGWEFTLGGNQFTGPSVHNVKFKGERIVYENALNNVVLVYAADTLSGNTIYMDASFGIGEFQDLMVGVDCPEHATLLEGTWWNGYWQEPVSSQTMCVFEADGQEAFWRRKDKFAAGLRNNYLVARSAMVVGNYDYTVEFNFFLDGRMNTRCIAAGFIQAGYWDPQNPHTGTDKSTDAFGYRVGEHAHGALHDHTFGFKVDLDIMGKDNRFEVIHWKAGDVLTALNTQTNISKKPAYFLYNQTRFIEYETTRRETGFKLDMSKPKFWTVVNDKHKNKWGVKRGYSIIPMATGSQVISDTHPAMDAISYTKYQCSVTKRKESEPSLTGTYDLNRLNDPLVSMDRMLNNEYIVNRDIVNWVTVGFLHIPTSEDVPMTNRVETGFWLKPHNYFDSTASFDMPQYVDTEDQSVTERPPQALPCIEPYVDDCYFCKVPKNIYSRMAFEEEV